ncbi:MAG: GNAT family N-acetyltransferase [Christensenellales bacterium]
MAVTESKRLMLRLMEPGDESCLQKIWCDEEVMRFCGGVIKPERIREIISYDRSEFAKHGNAVFAVIEKGSCRLVGICGCKLDEGNPRRGELIYHFKKGVWGKGFATEAVSAYIAWLKNNQLMDVLHASAMAGNTALLRLLANMGFIQKGFVRYADTGFIDEPFFEMKLTDSQH